MVSSCGRYQSDSGKRYFPTPNVQGYQKVMCKGINLMIHRLVHILFNDPELKKFVPGSSVDHLDRDKTNNTSNNLRWATKQQQRANTHHFNRSKPPNPTSVKVSIRRVDNPADRIVFASLSDAAKHFGLPKWQNFRKVKRMSQQLGWKLRYCRDADLPGEIWKPTVHGTMVSSCGRTSANGFRKIFPHIGNCGYRRINIKEIHYGVGSLVLEAFGFPKPSDDHSVDHINRCRTDDSLSNLRWATFADQAQNRMRTPTLLAALQSVEVQDAVSLERTVYSSVKEAADVTGIDPKSVLPKKHQSFAQRTNARGQTYIFRRVIDDTVLDLPGELWKPILREEWALGGRYHMCV